MFLIKFTDILKTLILMIFHLRNFTSLWEDPKKACSRQLYKGIERYYDVWDIFSDENKLKWVVSYKISSYSQYRIYIYANYKNPFFSFYKTCSNYKKFFTKNDSIYFANAICTAMPLFHCLNAPSSNFVVEKRPKHVFFQKNSLLAY